MAGFPSAPRCPSCGAELTTFQERTENACSNLKCRGPVIQQMIANQKLREHERRTTFAARVRESLQREFPGILSERQLLIVIPSLEGQLAEQPRERREEFLAKLDESMDEAKERAADAEIASKILREFPSAIGREQPSSAIINACSTCRGECCRNGREHAFLRPDFLAWRLLTEPDKSPEAMIDDYRTRLPEQSYDDSCMYHTATGCALPRTVRSFTCNRFLCTGIADHDMALQDDPNQPSVAVATTQSDQFTRVGVMTSSSSAPDAAQRVELAWPETS